MIIYVSRGVDGDQGPPTTFKEVLRRQRDSPHRISDDPASADIIIYPDCHLHQDDWRLKRLASSSEARAFPSKIYVYDERDRPWCRYPGIYVSMPGNSFHHRWQVAGAYYGGSANPALNSDRSPSLLFSFVGSPSATCRNEIYNLRHRRGHIQRVTGFVFYDPSSQDFEVRRRAYSEILVDSKFVLCPRGVGTSSIRLYECLAAGRVPVIIADQWVAPMGPKWTEFSIVWPEGRVSELPRYLEAREQDFETMSSVAQSAYEDWFAPDRVLSWQLNQLEERIVWRSRASFPSRGLQDGAWRQAGRAIVAQRTRHRLSPMKRMVIRAASRAR